MGGGDVGPVPLEHGQTAQQPDLIDDDVVTSSTSTSTSMSTLTSASTKAFEEEQQQQQQQQQQQAGPSDESGATGAGAADSEDAMDADGWTLVGTPVKANSAASEAVTSPVRTSADADKGCGHEACAHDEDEDPPQYEPPASPVFESSATSRSATLQLRARGEQPVQPVQPTQPQSQSQPVQQPTLRNKKQSTRNKQNGKRRAPLLLLLTVGALVFAWMSRSNSTTTTTTTTVVTGYFARPDVANHPAYAALRGIRTSHVPHPCDSRLCTSWMPSVTSLFTNLALRPRSERRAALADVQAQFNDAVADHEADDELVLALYLKLAALRAYDLPDLPPGLPTADAPSLSLNDALDAFAAKSSAADMLAQSAALFTELGTASLDAPVSVQPVWRMASKIAAAGRKIAGSLAKSRTPASRTPPSDVHAALDRAVTRADALMADADHASAHEAVARHLELPKLVSRIVWLKSLAAHSAHKHTTHKHTSKHTTHKHTSKHTTHKHTTPKLGHVLRKLMRKPHKVHDLSSVARALAHASYAEATQVVAATQVSFERLIKKSARKLERLMGRLQDLQEQLAAVEADKASRAAAEKLAHLIAKTQGKISGKVAKWNERRERLMAIAALALAAASDSSAASLTDSVAAYRDYAESLLQGIEAAASAAVQDFELASVDHALRTLRSAISDARFQDTIADAVADVADKLAVASERVRSRINRDIARLDAFKYRLVDAASSIGAGLKRAVVDILTGKRSVDSSRHSSRHGRRHRRHRA